MQRIFSLTILYFLASFKLFAQPSLFEKSFGDTYESPANDCTHYFQEGWIIGGHESVCDAPVLYKLDTAGNLEWKVYASIPGFGYGRITTVDVTNDSSIIVAGDCMPGDDIGPLKGFAAAFDGNGLQIWSQTYGLIPAGIIAKDNGGFYLLGDGRVLEANAAGDSIFTFLAPSNGHFNLLSNGNFIFADSYSLTLTDSNGVFLQSKSFSNILSVTEVMNDKILVCHQDLLELYDNSLNSLYSTPQPATVPFLNAVESSDSTIFLAYRDFYNETFLVSYNDTLGLNYTKFFFENSLLQRYCKGIAFNKDVIALWGNEQFSSINSFIKTFRPSDGYFDPLTTDIAITGFTFQFDSVSIDTIVPEISAFWFYSCEVLLKNQGQDTIKSCYLSALKPGGVNCAIQYDFIHLSNVNIAPGATYSYFFPVSLWDAWLIGDPPNFHYTYCLAATMPGGKLDNNLFDNLFCTIITAIEEPGLAKQSFQLYPNRNNGSFIVNNPFNSNAEIRITELTGKTIFKMKISEAENLVNFNAPHAGTYVLTIFDEEQVLVSKLVVE